MMESPKHTPGKWIAYQDQFQKENSQHWSVAIENQWGIHGVGTGDDYMHMSGVCSKADAELMASAKDLYAENERLKAIVRGWHYLTVGPDEMGDHFTQAQLVKASEPYASPALALVAREGSPA